MNDTRRRSDDPDVRASIRRTALVLASIALVFFGGVLASRLFGDQSIGMTVVGAAVFLFLVLGIGRHLGRK
ncbi:hypothetical protein BURK1_00935 [Burkholderiales bacterium]|nr:hypothetical protein BURK1_00935 [Burkholderiales bacterium]